MSRRLIRAAYAGRWCAFLNGYGSRELLTELGHGKPPVWNPRFRAWVGQPETITNALVLAEARGWATEVVDEDHLLALAGAERAEERGALW